MWVLKHSNDIKNGRVPRYLAKDPIHEVMEASLEESIDYSFFGWGISQPCLIRGYFQMGDRE